MRQSITVMLLMFLGLYIGVAACVAQEAEQTLMDEIKAVLTQHDQAFSEKNLSGVLETYGSDEKIILMGVGPGERWVGKAEIEQAYTNFFKDFDTGSVTISYPWMSVGSEGNIAWVLSVGQFADSLKDQKREYVLNLSVVLEKQAGQWRLITVHFSNLTGGIPKE